MASELLELGGRYPGGVMVVPGRRIHGIGSFNPGPRRRRVLGQMTDADRDALIATSTDDLVILAQIIHAGRIMTSSTFGGVIAQLAPAFKALRNMLSALTAFGMQPDASTIKAQALADEVTIQSSKAGLSINANADEFITAIASIILTREPDATIYYMRYSDEAHGGKERVTLAKGGVPGTDQEFNLDMPDKYSRSIEGVVDFVRRNKAVGDRFVAKAGSQMKGLGSLLVWWGILIAVIIAVVVAVELWWVADRTSISVDRSRLVEKVRQSTEKETLNRLRQGHIAEEMNDIAGTPAASRTPEQTARLKALVAESDILTAETAGLVAARQKTEQAIDSINKSKDLLVRLGDVLESGLKYFIYGGVGLVLLLIGLKALDVI